MKPPKLMTAKLAELNDNPKSAPADSWNQPPDPRPRLVIDSSQLAAIADWKVGETYMVEVKVMLKSSRLDSSPKGDRTIGEFVVTHIGIEDEEKEKSEAIDMNNYNN